MGLIDEPATEPVFSGLDMRWRSNFSKDKYEDRVSEVIDYIKAGDVFQVNLSQRFDAVLPPDFDAFAHYRHLRSMNPAPFAGFMNCGNIKISSASPERFLRTRGGRVETKPIKGTRPKDKNPLINHKNVIALKTSPKDRAENTMIVDLLRNDLSKVCLAHSIQVTELCAVESFASVHHLVSTVRGTLKKNKGPMDLLKACFPGGSITGAPKIRAMEIIDEMEPMRRGPYCGAMGYVGFDGSMDTNILIRTLVFKKGSVSLQAGGGIVVKSDPEKEYQETLDKAEAMFRSFDPVKHPRRRLGNPVSVTG